MALHGRDAANPEIHGTALGHFLGGMLVGGTEAHTPAHNLLAVDLVRTVPGQVVHTEPLPPQDAFHVVLQLRDLPAHDLWIDGRPVHPAAYPRHSVSIIDLSRSSRFRIATPHEALLFYIPRPALAEIAAEFGTTRFDGLRLSPGVAALDPVMARLGAALLSRLDGRRTHQLWIDQLLLLVQAHVADTYGCVLRTPSLRKGGLAIWQERRAKALIEEGLARPLTLAEVAQAVSLSPAHFARSFKRSTGLTPYGWLTRRRMDVASAMLAAGTQPIAAVAQAVGYAEQSSFTRAFLRHVGQTPASFARRRATRHAAAIVQGSA